MQIFLVSGISGAGKTVFIKELEDSGFFCADNLPVPLLADFVSVLLDRKTYGKVAVGIDVREKDFLAAIDQTIETVKKLHRRIEFRIVFLDARDEVLLRRYSETRRKHPIDTYNLEKGIDEERKLLKGLRDKADYVIDTTRFTVYELRRKVEEIVGNRTGRSRMSIKITSFGYKRGVPFDADIIFDMRFLANPFYIAGLKDKTGLDREVRRFLGRQKAAALFTEKGLELVGFMIENFDREGKNFVNIAFGCTGGRHRSVYMAEIFYNRLKRGYKDIVLSHRDLTC